MRTGKRSLVFVVVLFWLCSIVTSAHAKNNIIVISVPAADHGWTAGVLWWAQKAVSENSVKHSDIRFKLIASDSAAEQVKALETLGPADVRALVIIPYESKALEPVCAHIKKQGSFVIVVDRGLTNSSIQSALVTGDNRGLGQQAAAIIAQALNGKGSVAVMGDKLSVTGRDRLDGFHGVLKKNYPDIRVMETQHSGWNFDSGYKNMSQLLSKYKKIDAVWTTDDDILVGTYQAYRESGRKDIKIMLGGGASKTILKWIMNGDPLVRATITYPPQMIETAIAMAVERIQGRSTAKKVVVKSEVVTRQNADQFYSPHSVY